MDVKLTIAYQFVWELKDSIDEEAFQNCLNDDPNYIFYLKAREDKKFARAWGKILEEKSGIFSGIMRKDAFNAEKYYPIAVTVRDKTWYCTQDGEWIAGDIATQ